MSKNIFFTSERNYMKRDSSSGSTAVAAPVTSAYGGLLYVTNVTITHNLGFIPAYRVYYEPFIDGVIWPSLGTRLIGNATNPLNNGVTGPGLVSWPTSTQLNLQLFYTTNGLTGTYPVYYVIYKDYTI